MKILLLIALFCILCISSVYAQDVVINKFQNGGNALTGDGDVIELLVIRDHMNLQNYVIRDFAVSTNNTVLLDSITAGSGSFRFLPSSRWNDIRAGTLIVLRYGDNRFANYNDTTITTGLLNNINFSQSGNFNIGARDMIMLKSPDAPLSGTQGNVHAFSAGLTISDVAGISPLLRTSNNTGSSTSVAMPDNRAGNINDYIGNNAGTVSSAIFGSANNPANQRFLDSLRGLRKPLSVKNDKQTGVSHVVIAPQPMQSECTVNFRLETAELVSITIVDMLGKRRKIYSQHLAAGEQSIRLQLVDVSSGIYFLVINAGIMEWQAKFILKY